MISMLLVSLADAYSFVIFVYVMMSWIPMRWERSAIRSLTCSGASFPLLEEWWTLAQSWHCLCYSLGYV